MRDTATSLILSYLVAPWGLDGNPDIAMNGIALPQRVSVVMPAVVGLFLPTGSQIVLTFGDLAPEDAQRLEQSNGTSGTLTVNVGTHWVRPVGTITYASRILTLTLTSPCRADPWMTTGQPF